MKQICRLICVLGLLGAAQGAWAQPTSVVVAYSPTSAASVDVKWAAPRFVSATEYRVRWAQGAGSETWINDGGEDGVSVAANLAYTIPGLASGERYDVQVGAVPADSAVVAWSASVGGIVNSGRLTTLALTGPDGQAIALTPAFAPGTENYTASVGQAISSVSVTATTIGGGEFGFSKNQDAFRLLAVLSQTERMASGGAGIPVDLAVGANTLYVASASLPDSSAQVFGGLNPHVLTITRAAITTPAKITPAVTARATALRVNWSAPSGDFAAAYEITWRTAATDGADNMPGTTDDVAAGAWQNASGDDTDCAAAADPGAADDCGEDVGDVRAYTIASLTAATAYEVRARAINSAGNAPWSDALSKTTGAGEDATLSDITLSDATPGGSASLAPAETFDAETETYTAAAVNGVTMATVTPTVTVTGATVMVSIGEAAAATVISGSPSAAGALPEGGSLTFSIVVTATDNSTTKTYTLKVNRAIGAPGAPAAVTAAAGARADRADITWTPPTDFGGVSLTEASITAYRVRWRISDTDSGMPGAQPGDWLDSAGADAECNNADAADDAMCGEDPRSGSAYTISGLTNDTQHDVAVSAINSAGIGEWSGGTAAQITPDAEKDETLSELAVTGSDASTPALSPVFDADTTAYTAAVVNASISATVTATPTGDAATFSVKVGDADAAAGAAGMPSAAGAIDQGDSLLFVIVVTAESGGAVQTYSVTVTRAPGAPGAPQNVGATAGARSGNADITWKTPADFGDVTADATSLTSYRVRWRISDADSGMNGAQPGMWQDSSGDDAECNDADTANDAMCGEETSGDARHTLSGLTDDAQYDVAVAAINSAGAGEWSGDTDARVIPNDRRDAFLSALAVTGSDGAAQVLTKTGRRSDAGFEVMHLTYEVSLEAAVTSVSVTPTLSASGASITLNGAAHASGMPGGASARIDAGGSVTFNVLVTATGGDRNAYVVVVKRPLAAPAAPVARVEIGDLRLTLHWEASADPEGSPVTGYRTQVRAASYSSSPGVVINPGPWSSVADVSGGASARSHAFLNAFNSQSALRFRSGRPYDMQVAAVNTAGQGPWTLVSATAAAAAAPAKPLPVITDNAALTLTWAMPAANRAEITNYHVRWRTAATDGPDGTPGNTDDVAAGNWQGNTAAAGEPMVIGDTADGVDVGALLTHSIAGLTVGAAYDFQVRARNSIGNGEWSDSQSATIVAANIATLSALSINDGSNDLALTKTGALTTAGFDAAHETYSAPAVAADIAEVMVTATATATAAKITINGNAAMNGEATAHALGLRDNTLNIAVAATDGNTAKTYSVSIHRTPPPLAFAEEQPDVFFYADGSAALSVDLPAAADSGAPPYTYTLGGDALPSGLASGTDALSPISITGMPTAVTAVSESSLTYTLKDANAATALQSFSLFLAPALTFAATAPAGLTYDFNAVVSETLPELSGGFGTRVYALDGELPAGLMFDAAARSISGTPGELATAALTYRATDARASGPARGVRSAEISLRIRQISAAAPGNFAASAAAARLRLSWDALDITAGGGEIPRIYRARWRLKDADGAGAGTDPGAWQSASGDDDDGEAVGNAGSYTITGLSNDVIYETQAAAETSIGIGAWTASLEATPAALLAFASQQEDLRLFATSENQASLAVLAAAEHGTAPYTYALQNLPLGLSFNRETREISGAPVARSLPVTLTYELEDADGDTDTQMFTIVVDSLDVDFNGRINAADGIMVARYLLGVRGEALTDGQSNTDPATVERRIQSGVDSKVLNVDDDAAPDSDDGLLLARYLLGLRGDPLLKDLNLSGVDADVVGASIEAMMP